MQEALDRFYFDAFFMLKMNRVPGAYLEFGSGSNVRSFRFALKYSRLEPLGPTPRPIYSFDSFAGLPQPQGIDRHPQWQKGAMAVSLDEFRALMAAYDATDGVDYHTVEGFYDQSLPANPPESLGIDTAAFVHVDCDLYDSSKAALDYVTPILAHGAVLSFDDWFCFNGDPDLGEQRAFHEWRAENAGVLEFLPYAKFGWHGMSFLVKRLDR
ncbi:MAG: hypothetical protein H6898_08840 [Rhodobacter sp.]|nr:hypothetical protein [Rhodobacter sp.]